MDRPLQTAAATLVVVALVAGYVAFKMNTARRVRNIRAWYRAHPQDYPSKRTRILQILPLGLLLVAVTVWFVLDGKSGMLPLSVLGVACFAFLVYAIATGDNLPRE